LKVLSVVRGRFASRPIWIDATNLVRWGLQNPTGVQRVEVGLLSYALAHPETIGIGIMDRRLGRLEPASKRTLDYLRVILNRLGQPLQASRTKRLREEFRYLDIQMKYGDASTARRWAASLFARQSKKGFAFSAAKPFFKVILLGYSAIRLVPSLALNLVKDLVGSNENAVHPSPHFLISYELYSSFTLGWALKRAGLKPAHIIYDLIPINFPQYVSKRRTARISELFRSILVNSETAVTISSTVRDELSVWNDAQVKAPNISHVHACRLSSPVRFQESTKMVPILAGKRFAMFVSTFDLRKKAHLLVDVWGIIAKQHPDLDLPELALIGRRSHGSALIDEALKANAHIMSKVHLFHDLDDEQLGWCYQNALIGLFPTVAEGWGLAVSEFLVNGTPVIHSDIPILHEAAQSLMPSAPVGDAAAWAKVITPYLFDSQKLSDLRVRLSQDYQSGSPDDFAKCVIAALLVERKRLGFDSRLS
jgi:glycosyltransferase involved in cell wall biosynthesis